ncbi:MAG: serine hydroxymethyltransferase [Thermoplasmata archaeon]
MSNVEEALKVRDLAMQHNKFFEESIPLIASENVLSPLAKEMLLTDLSSRYAEGLPGKRYYQGNYYVDQIEILTTELAKKLFNTDYVDVRPISGTNANQAVVFALSNPGDVITTIPLASGAHISSAKFGTVGFRGLNPISLPFDTEIMNIDVDLAIKVIKLVKPKIALFGQSVFLFPTPLKDLKDALNEAGSYIWYDGAHVLGLIAGKRFQDPLREGAHVVSGSTHKTLPGPQRGIILGNPNEEDMWDKIQRAVFPGVISNHHLNTMAALGITLAEHLEFGESYADQVIRNAKKLAQTLHEFGFKVLGEKAGFTQSHTILVDVWQQGGGRRIAEDLEKANIVLNMNLLPYDDQSKPRHPGGIRIGTQEVTRIGMRESEMVQIAHLIKEVAMDKKDPLRVKDEVKELKSQFKTVKYCFNDNFEAYKYIKLV